MNRDVGTPMPRQYMLCVQLPGDTKLWRVGAYDKYEELAPAVRADIAAMGDTLGGLIEATSVKGRVYKAYRAEWSEVRIAQPLQSRRKEQR